MWCYFREKIYHLICNLVRIIFELTFLCVTCMQDDVEEGSDCAEKNVLNSKYGHSVELQTAPIGDGVLPGVVREVVIE